MDREVGDGEPIPVLDSPTYTGDSRGTVVYMTPGNEDMDCTAEKDSKTGSIKFHVPLGARLTQIITVQ